MKLLRLELTNFQGIKKLVLNFPEGCSASIYGDNATGKTTAANAATWLLFGKPCNGAKSFTPKTRTETGETHNLEHSVYGAFLHDGNAVSFTRTFREVYKRKRGRMEAEFSGHETVYAVNGVPASEKDYADAVNRLCGTYAAMLSMPDYFPAVMDWKERREILLDLLGGMTDETVFSANPELAELQDALAGHTVEDALKIARARMKVINSDKPGIPGKISELTAQIPEVKESVINLEAQQAFLQKEITDLRRRIEAVTAEFAEAREASKKRFAEAKGKAEAAEATERAAAKEIADLGVKYATAVYTRDFLSNSVKMCTKNAEEAKAKLEEVLFVRTPDDIAVCQFCGNKLPKDKAEDAVKRWLSKHNEDIKNARNGYNTAVQLLEEQKAELQKEERKIKDFLQQHDAAKKRHEEEKENLQQLKNFAQTAWAEAIHVQDACAEQTKELYATLEQKQSAISDIEKSIAKAEADAKTARTIRTRIEELKQEERAMAAEGERLYRQIYLGEEFIRRKVAMLTDGINRKFQSVKFQLFTEQINGGLKECCEVLIPSPDGSMVPWQFANNGARINAGLEIIGVLAKHYGSSVPVWVDNAESVTNLVAPDGIQIIRLCVSEKDSKLRTVTAV